ncbi:MAG: hypothetical protein IPN53_15235 [Comamonadaceae bacterium]|nr:hypothetical protein [Comamonadaceae bacterium]
MAKLPTPAAEIIDVPMNEALLSEDIQARNSLALATAQQASAVRAVALQMGYALPADCTDPDLIQRDISANMRRSVEACLEVGKGLRVLKEACSHGNFLARLDVLGIDDAVARSSCRRLRNFQIVDVEAFDSGSQKPVSVIRAADPGRCTDRRTRTHRPDWRAGSGRRGHHERQRVAQGRA